MEVADRVGDLFLLLLAFLVLPVAATSLLHVVGRVAQVLAGSPASIELLVWPLLLHRAVGRAEDEAVDAHVAEHDIGDDLVLVYCSMLFDI